MSTTSIVCSRCVKKPAKRWLDEICSSAEYRLVKVSEGNIFEDATFPLVLGGDRGAGSEVEDFAPGDEVLAYGRSP